LVQFVDKSSDLRHNESKISPRVLAIGQDAFRSGERRFRAGRVVLASRERTSAEISQHIWQRVVAVAGEPKRKGSRLSNCCCSSGRKQMTSCGLKVMLIEQLNRTKHFDIGKRVLPWHCFSQVPVMLLHNIQLALACVQTDC